MKPDVQPENDEPTSASNRQPNQSGVRQLPPDLLARIQAANEPGKKKEERLVAILLRDYPTGTFPAWGITMAILFLGQEHSDDCGQDHWLLNLVQIGDNDQTFSLNGEVQGGIRTLISWITGRSGTSLLDGERDATIWYRSARVLVREELERLAATSQG